jgi:hypothetical protein
MLDSRVGDSVNTLSVKEAYKNIMSDRMDSADMFMAKAWQKSFQQKCRVLFGKFFKIE